MSRSKPIGVTLVGAIMLVFGAISILIGILLAVGNVLIFDTPQPMWVLVVGAAIGLVVAYLAMKIGLMMLGKPSKGRRAGEAALWIGIPILWLLLWAVDLLLTEGQIDVTVLGLVVPAGVLLSVLLVGAALYMRSEEVRAYFGS